MNTNEMSGVYEIGEGVRKVEINPKRVAEWALIFTNLFFVSYFFIKLFRLY